MSVNIQVCLKKQIDDSYNIFVGKEILAAQINEIVKMVKANCYYIISDSNVYPFHGNTIKEELIKKGLKVFHYIFPAGEQSKNRQMKAMIEDDLIKNKAGRDSLIIALGGGVTGDMAGFVAATYQRGIPFVQIPTTLLSMVDSSIGGKVAVDTDLAKNMIGAFYQPKAVFVDVSTLKTLPEKIKLNGICEAIKHGIIFDAKYFDFITNNADKIKSLDEKVMIDLIIGSIKIKSFVVEQDEKEKGLRQILNFGHTIGHAVESLTNYTILHDTCVGIGIASESLIALKLGMINKSIFDKIIDILKSFDIPATIPKELNPDSIIEKTYLDKKTKSNVVKYVLPTEIGKVDFEVEVPESIVKEAVIQLQN